MAKFAEPEGDYLDTLRRYIFTKPLYEKSYDSNVLDATHMLLELFDSSWTLNEFLMMCTDIRHNPKDSEVLFVLPPEFGGNAYVAVQLGGLMRGRFGNISIVSYLTSQSIVDFIPRNGTSISLYEEKFNYHLTQLLEAEDARRKAGDK